MLDCVDDMLTVDVAELSRRHVIYEVGLRMQKS